MKATEGSRESVWVRKAAERQHLADPHADVLSSSGGGGAQGKTAAPSGGGGGHKRPMASSSSSSSSGPSRGAATSPARSSSSSSTSAGPKQRDLADRRSKLKVAQPALHHKPQRQAYHHVQHHDADDDEAQEMDVEESGESLGTKQQVPDKGEQKQAKPTKKQKREEKREQMERALARQQEVLATYQRNLKASVEQLRQQDADEFEFSDEDAMDEGDAYQVDVLLKATMGNYAGDQGKLDRTLEKIKESVHSVCMICFEKIKRQDATWQCEQDAGEGCYRSFHLICLQKWARAESQRGGMVADTSSSSSTPSVATWPCPNCRRPYRVSETPNSYECFCKKTVSPPNDPWLTPHSCGQTCHKPLRGCEHKCLLLCHPGPCPPCPQTVVAECYCGQDEQTRRCDNRDWSCGEVCDAMLPCRKHSCLLVCHKGPCPPCQNMSVRLCKCGKTEEERPCSLMDVSCGQVCGKSYSCGHHKCDTVCHSGPCGPCPLSGARTCPCGKQTSNLPCTAKVPSCGDTCDKKLACGKHRCVERCHASECPPCRVIVNKACRCGGSRKQMQCHMEFTCDGRCSRIRNCGKHPCKKRCCLKNCPPCSEVCNNKLSCGNHRCETTCHPGNCLPCPIMIDIACYCLSTVIRVPCGVEKKTEPPRCRKACKIPPTCHHPNRKPHRCHFGPCPPCDQICGVKHADCEHPCTKPCHDPIPPPVELTKKQKKMRNYRPPPLPAIDIKDVACAPCDVIVQRSCYGGHQIRAVECHTQKEFPCGDRCENPLECGNHKCQQGCHVITRRRRWIEDDRGVVVEVKLEESDKGSKDSCSKCEEPCTKPRDPPCPHPCPQSCHPGYCNPCDVRLKKKCHCKKMPIYVSCFQTHDPKLMSSLLSCGHQCLQPLLYCEHLCPAICHEGACPDSRQCKKKVKVRCTCGHQTEEWVCEDVQREKEKRGTLRLRKDIEAEVAKGKAKTASRSENALLACTAECEELRKKREAERLEEERLKKEEQERKKKERELQESTKATRGKQGTAQVKRTSRKWREEEDQVQQRSYRWLFILAAVVLLISLVVAIIIKSEWRGYEDFLWYFIESKRRLSNVNLWGRKRNQ